MLAPWLALLHVRMRTAIPCRNEGEKERKQQTNKQTSKQTNNKPGIPCKHPHALVLESQIQERSMNSTASHHLLLLLLLIHRVGT